MLDATPSTVVNSRIYRTRFLSEDVSIGRLASWTGLAVSLALLEGCSTTTDMRQATLWAAATECANASASTKVDRIDDDGRVHLTLFAGSQHDVPAFNDCYRRTLIKKAIETVQTTGSARIVESPTFAEASVVCQASRVTSVPIQRAGPLYLVPVVLNGNHTATFLLDTGASVTSVTPDLLRRAGLELPSSPLKTKMQLLAGREMEVPWLRLKSISVGLARIDTLSVAVVDVSPLYTPEKPRMVDGILGTSFLGRFTMTIDPRAGTLTLQLDDVPVK